MTLEPDRVRRGPHPRARLHPSRHRGARSRQRAQHRGQFGAPRRRGDAPRRAAWPAGPRTRIRTWRPGARRTPPSAPRPNRTRKLRRGPGQARPRGRRPAADQTSWWTSTNAISVAHLIPVGGEDLDHIKGAMRLVRATGEEDFVHRRRGAVRAVEHPDAGEIVWCERRGRHLPALETGARARAPGSPRRRRAASSCSSRSPRCRSRSWSGPGAELAELLEKFSPGAQITVRRPGVAAARRISRPRPRLQPAPGVGAVPPRCAGSHQEVVLALGAAGVIALRACRAAPAIRSRQPPGDGAPPYWSRGSLDGLADMDGHRDVGRA